MKIIGYRTVNMINQHFYYGVRTLRKDSDPYLGSGIRLKRAIDKYGKENFIREDLVEFETFKQALEWERNIITRALIESEECYNLKPGGAGGRLPWTEEQKQQYSNSSTYRKSEETKKKLAKATIERFKNSPGTFTGKTHSEETKKLLSTQRKNKPSLNKGKKLNLSEERLEKMRQPKSEEHKIKISRTLCKLSEEQIRFLKDEFIDLYGERSKLARKWGINLDQIARIIGRRYEYTK